MLALALRGHVRMKSSQVAVTFYGLIRARRNENRVENSVSMSAKAIHPAFACARACCTISNSDNFGHGGAAATGIRRASATPMQIPTSRTINPKNTGTARTHGNGIGCGAAASTRTARMTEETKPEDGAISS